MIINNNEIVIDFGHGGIDPGACSDGYQEKVWAKETGEACVSELKRHNVIVHLTRLEDETLSISQRCAIANKTNAKWFVSIHYNSGKGNRGEVIHSIYKGEGEKMALEIAKELKFIGQSLVKIYDRVGNNNKDYYGVIRGTKMHSVIVEVCFIDNERDRKIADTLEKRQSNGKAIAYGILNQIGITINKDGDFNESNISSRKSFENGSYSGMRARVNVSSLNVRYDRWINGVAEPKVIGTLKLGDVVDLEFCLSGWISIRDFKGNKGLGYVNSKYLKLI